MSELDLFSVYGLASTHRNTHAKRDCLFRLVQIATQPLSVR
jgi:hypothetical protein